MDSVTEFDVCTSTVQQNWYLVLLNSSGSRFFCNVLVGVGVCINSKPRDNDTESSFISLILTLFENYSKTETFHLYCYIIPKMTLFLSIEG